MQAARMHFLAAFLTLGILLFGAGGGALAQPISPAMEQEFQDARSAIASAQEAQAEKFSPEPLKQAQELLATAEKARGAKDAVKFAQAWIASTALDRRT